MKTFLPLLVFLHLFLDGVSQVTYLKRMSFNHIGSGQYPHPEDSILHLLDFSLSLDGYSFVNIANQRGNTEVLKLDSAGNIMLPVLGGGYNGGMQESHVNGLHATPDGGCIYAYIHSNWSGNFERYSIITKYSNSGVIEWTRQLPSTYVYPLQEQETFDIALLPNGYACLSEDSTYILNFSGNLQYALNFKGPGTILGFQNGDLFINGNGFQGRVDGNGNVRYTLSGEFLHYDTTLYSLSGDTLYKVDGLTGAFISSVYYPLSGLNKKLIMKDGGLTAYSSFLIKRFASAGNLKWSEPIPLPHFGINLVGEQSDGTLLTGGTYLCQDVNYYPEYDFSFFLTTIDTSGHSIIDSTTQVWPGDANDDGIIEFGDVIYVALAQGSTGPQRFDTATGNYFYTYGGEIAVDFPESFAMGVNHKQCDIHSDGIIDSLDIASTAFQGLIYRGRPSVWRLSNQEIKPIQSNSTLPYFSCVPDRDSAFTGDTVRIYYILGDNGIAIDSIFGLAFHLSFDSLNTFDVAGVLHTTAVSSDLGSLPDLRSGCYAITGVEASLFAGRKDLQNAYFVQDTIGYSDIVIFDSTGGFIDLNMSLLSFKAITAGGFPIDFQFHPVPLHLNTHINSSPDLIENKIDLFPNPAREQVLIDHLPSSNCHVQIFSDDGKECFSGYTDERTKLTLDVSCYPKGLYLISIRDEMGNGMRRKIVKE